MPSKAFLECGAIVVCKFGYNQNSSKAHFRMWAILVYEFGLIEI